ncbi:cytochrome c [Myxococcota bacterium]|nr:cytochrome c [Myxococcota bacterium]
MKASSLMAKGRAPARQADMVAHAQAMQGLSTYLLDMFPAGTGPDVVAETEALAEVWTDWTGFQARAQDFATESQALVTTAQGGDVAAFGAQLGKVGATCGACHDSYRKGD